MKWYYTRFLFFRFNDLLGRDVIQQKRNAEQTLGYQPLTATTKYKVLDTSTALCLVEIIILLYLLYFFLFFTCLSLFVRNRNKVECQCYKHNKIVKCRFSKMSRNNCTDMFSLRPPTLQCSYVADFQERWYSFNIRSCRPLDPPPLSPQSNQ